MANLAAFPSRRTILSSVAAASTIALASFARADEHSLAADVLALFEPTATSDARRAFHDARISPAGQRRWPFAEFDRITGALSEVSGGFDLVSSTQRGSELWLQARARRQGVTRTIRVRIDREDATRVFDISTSPMPTPYDGPAPDGAVASDVLAALIDRRIRFAAERDEFSGAARVVAPSGEVIYEAAFGMAHREMGEANAPDTRFNLGSADKSFTALMIANLIGAGRLSFDTRLVDVLPTYPNRAFAEACLMRHLLSHSAGLGMLFNRSTWEQRRAYARMDEMFGAFASEAPAFAPGSRAAYSNEGFVVLGAVVEALTGKSWYEVLSEQIYARAGMSRSGHFLYQELPDATARGYRYHQDDHLGLNPRQNNAEVLGYRGNSCGGGYSTVRDMTAYLTALRSGALAPSQTVEGMVRQAQPGLGNYGLGFDVRAFGPGRTVVGHGGSGVHMGIDGDSGVVWETGWAFSVLGNYDSPFAKTVASDLANWLALQS